MVIQMEFIKNQMIRICPEIGLDCKKKKDSATFYQEMRNECRKGLDYKNDPGNKIYSDLTFAYCAL